MAFFFFFLRIPSLMGETQFPPLGYSRSDGGVQAPHFLGISSLMGQTRPHSSSGVPSLTGKTQPDDNLEFPI